MQRYNSNTYQAMGLPSQDGHSDMLSCDSPRRKTQLPGMMLPALKGDKNRKEEFFRNRDLTMTPKANAKAPCLSGFKDHAEIKFMSKTSLFKPS